MLPWVPMGHRSRLTMSAGTSRASAIPCRGALRRLGILPNHAILPRWLSAVWIGRDRPLLREIVDLVGETSGQHAKEWAQSMS